jgi:hypothetical protein
MSFCIETCPVQVKNTFLDGRPTDKAKTFLHQSELFRIGLRK